MRRGGKKPQFKYIKNIRIITGFLLVFPQIYKLPRSPFN